MVLTFYPCLYLRNRFLATQRPELDEAETTMQMPKATKLLNIDRVTIYGEHLSFSHHWKYYRYHLNMSIGHQKGL